jgi:hypothetical protein
MHCSKLTTALGIVIPVSGCAMVAGDEPLVDQQAGALRGSSGGSRGGGKDGGSAAVALTGDAIRVEQLEFTDRASRWTSPTPARTRSRSRTHSARRQARRSPSPGSGATSRTATRSCSPSTAWHRLDGDGTLNKGLNDLREITFAMAIGVN